MWISSTHIMLIRKSSRRCQKWGTIIIVTFYVFVKYSILGIISSSRWIICFFNFSDFSICQVSTGDIQNFRENFHGRFEDQCVRGFPVEKPGFESLSSRCEWCRWNMNWYSIPKSNHCIFHWWWIFILSLF